MGRGRKSGGMVALMVSGLACLALGACGGGAFDEPDFDFGDDPISFGPAVRESPAISMAANGKATCVWIGDNHIYAERFIPGFGWTDYRQIDTSDAEAHPPQVAMDPMGDAVVVWEQDGQIVANCFEVGTGWRGAEPISDPASAPASEPHLGSAADGGTVVVWEEGGAVVGATFDPVVGWAPPVPIATPALPANDVDLSVTPSGDAVAVWDEGDAGVATSTFDAASQTWSPPVVIGAGDAPQIAVDDFGNGVVVFEQAGVIVSVVHDPATGWQAPVEVPIPAAVAGLPASVPAVDLGAGGKGGVAFDLGGEVYASPYEVGAGFAEALPLAPGMPAAGGPALAVDEDGNAFVVFEDTSGHVQTIAYREVYDDWLAPEDGGPGHDPVVDVNDEGEAISVFVSGSSIGAVRVRELDPTTPAQLTVTVVGQGRVGIDPLGVECFSGAPCAMFAPLATTVHLMATPLPGFRFSHWEGVAAAPVSDPSVDLFMAAATSVNAVFVSDP